MTTNMACIKPCRIIGLTGGIASGKSTVSRYLATAYHLPVLDADIYAREVVKTGSQSSRRSPNVTLMCAIRWHTQSPKVRSNYF